LTNYSENYQYLHSYFSKVNPVEKSQIKRKSNIKKIMKLVTEKPKGAGVGKLLFYYF
jgi:hypothetical protein